MYACRVCGTSITYKVFYKCDSCRYLFCKECCHLTEHELGVMHQATRSMLFWCWVCQTNAHGTLRDIHTINGMSYIPLDMESKDAPVYLHYYYKIPKQVVPESQQEGAAATGVDTEPAVGVMQSSDTAALGAEGQNVFGSILKDDANHDILEQNVMENSMVNSVGNLIPQGQTEEDNDTSTEEEIDVTD